MKRAFHFVLLPIGILALAYYLQPSKTGKGKDETTQYSLVKNWPQLPPNFKLGNPTGIGIDNNEHIFVFQRADREWPFIGSMPKDFIAANTILELDKKTGQLLNSWGKNMFIMPHGLTVDNQNNIWVTDVGAHQVFKFTHEGKLLMKLGVANTPGNDSTHFNQPTDIAVTNDESFYVSDGYGNSRIMKFSATGKYLFQWGSKGSGEGQFNIPHSLSLDNNQNVYVADRENNRIQIFDPNGKFIKQYADASFASICAVSFDPTKKNLIAVDDLTFLKIKHKGSDLFIFDSSGNIQTRFGRSSFYTGSISWYHDAVIDKKGSIYMGDILGNTLQQFERITTLQIP